MKKYTVAKNFFHDSIDTDKLYIECEVDFEKLRLSESTIGRFIEKLEFAASYDLIVNLNLTSKKMLPMKL